MVRDSAGDYSYIRRSRGLKIEIVEGESGVRNLVEDFILRDRQRLARVFLSNGPMDPLKSHPVYETAEQNLVTGRHSNLAIVITKGSYKIGVHEVAAELKVRISLVSRPRSAAPRRISASLKGFSSLQPFFGGIQPTEPHPGVLVMKICYVRFSYSL